MFTTAMAAIVLLGLAVMILGKSRGCCSINRDPRFKREDDPEKLDFP